MATTFTELTSSPEGSQVLTNTSTMALQTGISTSATIITFNSITVDDIIDTSEYGLIIPVTGEVTGGYTEGNKVTIEINGKIYNTTLKADGTFSVDIAAAELVKDADHAIQATVELVDAAGNSSIATAQAIYQVLVPQAPTITFESTGTDNVYNIAEVGSDGTITATIMPSAGTKVGDTLTVNGVKYTVTTEMLTKGLAVQIAPGSAVEAVTTSNGIASQPTTSTAPQADLIAPTATVSLNPITADNAIDTTEYGLTIPVTGKVTGEYTVGNIVSIVVNGKTYSNTVKAGGTFYVNIPATELVNDADSTIQATVKLTDAAGNPGTATTQATYTVAMVKAPTISFESTGTDNVYNIAEVGSDGTITATIMPSAGTNVGDTIRVNGKDYTVTADMLTNGLPVQVAPGGYIQTSVVTAKGYTTPTSEANAPIADLTAPTATISLNPITADNTIDTTEYGLTIPVTGKVIGEFTTGNTVTVNINGKAYSTTINADGTFAVNVAASELVSDSDKAIQATVALVDAAGNTASASTQVTYTVGSVKAPTITFESTGADNIYNIAEVGPDGTITATIMPSAGTKVGDILTVNGTNYTVTTDMLTKGLAVQIAPGSVLQVVTVADGVASPAVCATAPQADLIAPTATVSLNPITADNAIDTTEYGLTIPVTGKVTGEYTVGNIVSIVVNGKTYSNTVKAGGTFYVNIPATELVNDADSTIQATVKLTDAAGNPGTATTQATYNVASVKAPTISFESTGTDNVYNIAEVGSDGTITATIMPSAGTKVGDTLTVNGVKYTVTTEMLTKGLAVQIAPGSAVEAVTTSNGIASQPTTSTAPQADLIAPTATVSLNPITADNAIDTTEYGLTIPVTGKVTGEYTVGNIVSIVVNGKTYSNTVKAGGTFYVNIPATELVNDADSTIQATVKLTDAAGNPGTATTQATYTVAMVKAPTITFESTGADNVYNIAEVGSDGTITAMIMPSVGTNVGDTIRVNGKDYTVTADMLTNGLPVQVAPGGYIQTSVVTAKGYTTPTSEANAPIADLTAPTATISLNPITADNTIDTTEYGLTIPVTGKVIGEFTTGNTVTVNINGKAYSTTVNADGTFAVNVAASELVSDSDKAIQATVALVDAAGNTASASTQVTYTVGSVKAPTITFESTGADNIYNIAEVGPDGTITATIMPSAGTKVGDILTVNGTNYTVTTDMLTKGLAVQIAPGSVLQVVTVADGVASPAVCATAPQADLTAPTAAISLHPITADNVIDTKEYGTTVAVTGVVKGEFTTGDKVTLNVNGQNYTGIVDTAGNFSILVPGKELANDGDKTIQASITLTDTAGNLGNASTQATYGVSLDSSPQFLYHLGYHLYGNVGPADANGKKGATSAYQTTDFNDNIYIGYKGFDSNGNLIISPNDGDFKRDYYDGNVVWKLDTQAGNDLVQIREDQGAYTVAKLGEGDDRYYVGGSLDSDISYCNTNANARAYVLTESGNDSVIIGGNAQGKLTGWGVDGGRIFTGSGSDNVLVYGTVDDGAVIDLGTGNMTYANNYQEAASKDTSSDINTLRITGNLGNGCDYAYVFGGDGQDNVTVDGYVLGTSRIELGAHNDSLKIGGDLEGSAKVNMGDGDNTIKVGGFVEYASQITAGSGNDVLQVGAKLVGQAMVNLGDGNNTVQLGGLLDNATLFTGSGQDTIDLGQCFDGMTGKTAVSTGAGNDTISFHGSYMDGIVNGGAGKDTLILDNNKYYCYTDMSFSTKNINGIEKVQLDGTNVLDVRYSDLVADTGRSGALMVTGASGSKVDIGANNWNTDPSYCASLNDASGGKWAKTGTQTVDGIQYDVYHHSYAGASTANDLYIQQGLTVI